jgi:uncharacterized protein
MNGKVVCNTGPLLALLITDQVDVLRHIFKEVIIPETVHDEILDGGAINSGLSNYRAITWINVMSLSNPPDPLLMTSLDAGEAAVIRLAMELKADFTLIDERKARKIARTIYGQKVIGSARILVEAKRLGLIENVSVILQRMRDGGYWLGDSIVEAVISEAGEKR